MARQKRRIGKDATLSILARYLHPTKYIREKYENMRNNQRVEDLVAVRMDRKIVSRREQVVIVVTSEEFKDDDELVELYAVPRWFSVVEEGPEEDIFDMEAGPKDDEASEEEEEVETIPEEVLQGVIATGAIQENQILELAAMGVPVDDDNDPLEENKPTETDETTTSVEYKEWGHDGICFRRQAGGQQVNARLLNFSRNILPTSVQLFEHLFPKDYLQDVLIQKTNEEINYQNSPITYGEMLRFFGIWFTMATTNFENRRDFWSTKPPTRTSGAPYRFSADMSRNRFELILQSLVLTDAETPAFKDPFWEIRQLQDAWNDNMRENFTASWLSVLDESMSKWLNAFTCPGFMCVPRKPWPLGNEWHTICCAKSGVMYCVELVEGKDRPKEMGPKEFSEKGKTVGLLQRLTKSLWHTSKAVILDSGFCVLQGIIELRKKGVFAAALIKKRRYWPKHVRGDEIASHFDDKEVGTCDALQGTLDYVPFHIFAMKEPNYVMSLMATYGTLRPEGKEKKREFVHEGKKKIRTFLYPEVVSNYFGARDKVDSHNSLRMHPLSLEETWKTRRWALRVLQFLLAVTEVNVKLVMENLYGATKMSQQEFRKKFSNELINNPYLEEEKKQEALRQSRREMNPAHEIKSLEPFTTFAGTTFAKCKTRYIQLQCTECKTRCRTYCSCQPGNMLCLRCFQKHLLSS